MFPVHQVWPNPSCKAQWKGEEDKADKGRGGKTTSGNGQALSSASPRGQWRTGKVEKTGCKIICGAPTTLAVKGLMMTMKQQARSRQETVFSFAAVVIHFLIHIFVVVNEALWCSLCKSLGSGWCWIPRNPCILLCVFVYAYRHFCIYFFIAFLL